MFSKKEKIGIIAAFVLILIFGAIAIGIMINNNAASKQAFHLGGKRLTANGSDDQQYTDGTTDEYTISYPENWDAVQQPVAGGGNNTTVTIPESDSSGVITIQSVSADTASLEQVEGVFTGFNYKKEQGIMQDVPAVRYTGNVNNAHEVVYVFEKDNTVYTIMLTYASSEPNQTLEDQFTKIADSFTFN